MKLIKILPVLLSMIWLSSCGPRDEDIKTAVTEKLATIPGTAVNVKDGIVTVSGEVRDMAEKAAIDAALEGIKGVKSIINNITIAAPAISVPAIHQ